MKANKFPLLAMFVACFASQLFSDNQSSNIHAPFVRKIEGAGTVIDAIQTKDGNYVTLSVDSSTRRRWIVRKSTPDGERVWENSLSFQNVSGHFSFRIAETSTGYVIVGSSSGGYYFYGYSLVGIVFLRSDGTLRTHKILELGDYFHFTLSFDSVIPTPDGGFIVTGAIYPSSRHLFLVRFTAAGTILWQRGFENLSDNFVSHPTLDNAIVLASQSLNNQGQSIGENLIKVDRSGRIVWGKALTMRRHTSVALGHTLDNGTLLATKLSESNSLSLIALNSAGNFKWTAKYKLSVTNFSVSSVMQTPDSGYVVSGTTHFPNGSLRGGFFIKINGQRNLVSQKTFGYAGVPEEAHSVFAAAGGGYLLIGSSNNDVLFLGLNSDGVVPGCNFFQNLSAKRLPAPNVAIRSLASILENHSEGFSPTTRKLVARASRSSLITICEE